MPLAPSNLPPPADPLFTLANLGSGTQITRIRANGRDWYFDEAPLIKILLWDTINEPPTNPILPEHFTNEQVVQDASSFTITWSNITNLPGDTSSAVVTAAFSGGVLSITACTITLSAAAAVFFGVWGVDINLLIKPYETANKADMQCLWPGWGGQVLRNTTAVLVSDLAAPHPGIVNAAPQVNYIGNYAAGLQAMYHYQRGKNAGLLIRTKDTLGRTKVFAINGDGSNVIAYVRIFNENNLAIGQNFSLPYHVTLEPRADSVTKACERLRSLLQTEAVPGVSRGKIKDDSGNAISTIVKTAPMIYWADIDFFDASQVSKVQTDITRIVSSWGVTPVVFVYHWHNNAFGTGWPSWSPVQSEVDAFVSAMDALGCRCIFYYRLDQWSPNAWFTTGGTPPANHNAAYGTPASQQILLSTQSPKLIETTEYVAQLGVANARSQIQDQALLVLNAGARKCRGFYDDGGSNITQEDFRTSLTDAQTGAGSSYFWQGKRSLYASMRTAGRLVFSDFAIVSEQPTDLSADICEWNSQNSFVPALYTVTFWPMFRTVLGEYTPLFGFDSYGIGVVGGEFLTNDFIWNTSKHFHDGKALTLVANSNTVAAAYYVVPQGADPTHADITAYATYFKSLVQALDSGPAIRAYIQRGRRLEPLPGSYDEYIEANGITFSGGSAVNFTNADVQSSVWKSDETGKGVAILITNHGSASGSATIAMDSDRYPDIGGSSYLYENVAGTRTLVKSFFGAFTHTVTMAAKTLRVFEVLTS